MPTAYDEYLHATELHALQHPLSETSGEMSFLVVCQIQELYFGLVRHDLDEVRRHLDDDDPGAATAVLRRVSGHFAGLNASWRSLAWMTPADFQPIKQAMGATYGRSSSLQSWTYRHMVYLLGLKDAALAEPLADADAQHAELLAALAEPSVYDAALGLLARAGHAVSDPSDVERAWGQVQGSPLGALADAMFDVAEGFVDYKHHHLVATRRTLGGRAGYYGTSGVEWLRKAVDDVPFPQLWSLRVPGE
jgi:tryptophan 2,3-dioxygenase